MTGKYHNHTLQVNPLNREEETQNTNSHTTQERQLKQSNQLSIPQRDVYKTRMNSNYHIMTSHLGVK